MAVKRVPTTSKVISMLNERGLLEPVLDKDLTSPPGSPSEGDRYIVGSGATGDWSGHDNEIAEWNGSSWDFGPTLTEGLVVYVKDENDLYVYDGSSWIKPYGEGAGAGDMLKSVYDTDDDGIVDKAESIDDGAGNSATAAEIKDAVDKRHTAGTETLGGDLSGTVSSAIVDTVGGKTSTEIADAVDKAHNQNTDQYLDYGGANEVSASELRTALDTTIPSKADKVSGATDGNLASLDSNGNLQDSGIAASNIFDTSSDTLDDIDDGSTYGKVKLSELNNGTVIQLNDGTNTVTAAQGKKAYDTRAQYDASTDEIVFVDPDSYSG